MGTYEYHFDPLET